MNLYLDDMRDCPNNFILAKNYQTALYLIENNDIDILSLDHDLGEDKDGNLLKNGYDLVKYFCENGLYAKRIYIHTDNPVGRENMYKTLLGAQNRGFIDKSIKIFNYAFVKNKYTGKEDFTMIDYPEMLARKADLECEAQEIKERLHVIEQELFTINKDMGNPS